MLHVGATNIQEEEEEEANVGRLSTDCAALYA
jgi:hypothetical protein